MDQSHGEGRIGAIGAMSGAVLLVVGTYLHPSKADPNDAARAFAEYAADQLWVASHLMQYLGIVLMVGALVLLSRRLAHGPAAHWAHLGMAGAIGSLAVTSALQAVDGVALKVMVDAWAGAPEAQKPMLFQAAFAVRQVEIGLASLMSVVFAVTVVVYGVGLVVDPRFPRWLGVLGIAGGVSTLVAGVVMAYTGFSEVAMAISMPSSILLLAWMISVGIFMWPGHRPEASRA